MRQRDDLVFPMAEFESRLARTREAIAARGLDAAIITTPENLFYLTGYQTPGYYWFQALVVPVDREPFMVTRLLEDSNVQARTWVSESRPYRDYEEPAAALARAMVEFGLARAAIGYEKDCFFFLAAQQEVTMAELPAARFENCSGLVESQRLVKSDAEIAMMRLSAIATEKGMQAGIDAVRAGVSENEVAAQIQAEMTRAGGEYPGIAPFVASGWRGALGHATWDNRMIEPGDAVFLEVGGCARRYHTAMMRTVFVGEVPARVREAETLVRTAMDETMAAIRPGITAEEVDRIAREVIAVSSPGVEQAGRTGYSIGIAFPPDWGEGHILSLLEGHTRALEKNMTFHLIPWIQVPGYAGIGLSETIRVTETGCESFFTMERKVFTAA